MFSGLTHLAAFTPPGADSTPRKPPPPTEVKFPQCTPQAEHPQRDQPLVSLLQSIQRPADIQLSHFEALGLHVVPNASSQDILPDASFLPPVEEWTSISPQDIEEVNPRTKKPLNNGNQSPGIQTYLERVKELSLDNTAAFRTVRRIQPPPGEQSVRLGNAYEFYKNLEFFSGYWVDTSLPPKPEEESKPESDTPPVPTHLQTHVRTGNGSQLPPDYRQQLLTAFIKLVAYDFGCNVSLPRCEPRLLITPGPSSKTSSLPPSYFSSGCTFIYRSPTDRTSARAGIVEGPLATLSCRTATVFTDKTDEHLDLAREVVAVLLTAQQRARSGKTETRFGEGKWWTEKKRWGGGPGGPIGREVDKVEVVGVGEKIEGDPSSTTPPAKAAAQAAASSGPSPAKRTKKERAPGNMSIYDNYRKLAPPSSTWDRKARYEAIGKIPGAEFDDIFLVSALNHHVAIIRVRVPNGLLDALEGKTAGWEKLMMWRSRWFDLFLAKERIEAMQLVWGMMGYMMRKLPEPQATSNDHAGAKIEGQKMEVDG